MFLFFFLDVFGFEISKFTDSQIPDAAGAAAGGRTLGSQPDCSPNAHRDQICRKEPGALAATGAFIVNNMKTKPLKN